MFDTTPLEQFSALDDFAATTPVWRPFVQQASLDQHKKAQECAQKAE